jgi:hypothetical protein
MPSLQTIITSAILLGVVVSVAAGAIAEVIGKRKRSKFDDIDSNDDHLFI